MTTAERDKLPDSAFAGPGRTFPITDQESVESAARLIGHAADPEKVKARIIAIAKRLGLKIPDAWKTSKGKSATAAVEHKSLPFQFKVSEGGHGAFEGLAAAFHNVDAVGDVIAPGAFRDGLAEFLKTGFVGGIGHDWDVPIGHPAEARETPEGLYVKGVFDGSPEAQAARARLTPHPETGRATISRLSIGYRVEPGGSKSLAKPDEIKAHWASVGYTPTGRDAERSTQGVRLLTKLKLFEVSPVLIPANDLARTTGVKSGATPGFAESSRKVASIARELSEEFEGFVRAAARRAGVRLKEGRVLSEANRRAMQDVLDQHRGLIEKHGALCDSLAGVLERTKPPAKSDATAAPAIDADDITQRFIATFEALADLA